MASNPFVQFFLIKNATPAIKISRSAFIFHSFENPSLKNYDNVILPNSLSNGAFIHGKTGKLVANQGKFK